MAHLFNCLTSKDALRSAVAASISIGAGCGLEKINAQTRFQPMALISGGAGLAVVESLATSALSRLPGCKEYKRCLSAATCALFEGVALWYVGGNSQKTVQFISKQIACYALISLTVSSVAKQLPQTKNWADLAGIVGRACTATYFSTLWPNSSLVALSALRQVFFIGSELYPLLKNWYVTPPGSEKDKLVITRNKTPSAPPLVSIEDKIKIIWGKAEYTFNGEKYYKPFTDGADHLVRKCKDNGWFNETDREDFAQIGTNGEPCTVWRLSNAAQIKTTQNNKDQKDQLILLKKEMEKLITNKNWRVDRVEILPADALSGSGPVPNIVDIVLYHKKVED